MIKKKITKDNYAYIKVNIGKDELKDVNLDEVMVSITDAKGVNFWEVESITTNTIGFIVDDAIDKHTNGNPPGKLESLNIDAMLELYDLDFIDYGKLDKFVEVLVKEYDVE